MTGAGVPKLASKEEGIALGKIDQQCGRVAPLDAETAVGGGHSSVCQAKTNFGTINGEKVVEDTLDREDLIGPRHRRGLPGGLSSRRCRLCGGDANPGPSRHPQP